MWCAQVPGVEATQLLNGHPRREYVYGMGQRTIVNGPHTYEQVVRWIAVSSGEDVHQRVSFTSDFQQLHGTQGIKIQCFMDGQARPLFSSIRRTSDMRTALFREYRRSFDHIMKQVIRCDHNFQREPRYLTFVEPQRGKYC